MNIASDFIELTKGLVEGASSKIHAIGHFTEEIQLERGVRQGCPLAPLLFSLPTQPLMTILKNHADAGLLPGLQINAQKAMLHSLFADDSGVTIQADEAAFLQLHEAVRCYERISGARLNLEKSTVIPLGLDEIPPWLQSSGCHISSKGEIVRYLGFPIGWGISDDDQKDYIVAKLKKKLGTWVFRILPFAGRVVALKHVLRAVPVHLLSSLNLQRETMAELETISMVFLWGTNKEGKPKIPLIAWNEIQRPKSEGGLGLTALMDLSVAMRIKQVCKFFLNPSEDWVQAAEQLIRTVNNRGGQSRERASWTIQEILLLQCPTRVPGAPTISGLLGAWKQARRQIQLQTPVLLHSQSRPKMLVILASTQGWISRDEEFYLLKTIKTLKLESLQDWYNWLYQNTTTTTQPREQILSIQLLSRVQRHNDPTPISDWQWSWKIKSKDIHGWDLSTRRWKTITRVNNLHCSALNKKWECAETPRRWAKKLRKLWKSPIPNRDKVWIWKVLQAGLPTMERAAKWRDETSTCKRCRQGCETLTHLFIDCPAANRIWQDWERLCQNTPCEWKTPPSLLQRWEESWETGNLAKLILLTKSCWIIWLDRNKATYTDQQQTTPLLVTGRLAIITLKALIEKSKAGSKTTEDLSEALDTLTSIFQSTEDHERATLLNARTTNPPTPAEDENTVQLVPSVHVGVGGAWYLSSFPSYSHSARLTSVLSVRKEVRSII
ncbi:hypothetical protein R1sor_001850 [Riccia sorocarpa]|uniref:Reverse transcriptase domain-containing protein n=1 Tax=Riccia sorocarpa TaxID=122646 RepID=A0ABD3GXZ3_9MARC